MIKNIKEELIKIQNEACDRVWFDRSDICRVNNQEQINKIVAEQQRVIKDYNIDRNECDDFYHGYWSGILALSRYLMNDIHESYADLQNGDNGLLDT